MVSRERMVSEFVELVKIDSPTLHERRMADALKAKLGDMGISAYEDNAGEKIGGDAGNLIFTVKGQPGAPALLLMAHMDTVAPGVGKKPVVDGDIIRTDGTTILGADDVAGIEAILEALRVLKEDGIAHGDIQVVFTVAEEDGLLGAKNLDYSRIYARYGIVLDHGGEIGKTAVKAPSHNIIDVVIDGKAAHAGVEPQNGINAIQVASNAISRMKLGRIDEETTANIGIIHGGHATNVVCDRVEIKGEARSRDENKLSEQTDHMRVCFEEAASELGARLSFKSTLEYPAFCINENDEIIEILRKAADESGVVLKLESTGGGSDTNIINGRGIQSVAVSVGMQKVHSVEEHIDINNLVKAAEFLVAAVRSTL